MASSYEVSPETLVNITFGTSEVLSEIEFLELIEWNNRKIKADIRDRKRRMMRKKAILMGLI
jgi:hypothetical protein